MYAVGDRVVHPNHGAGTIERIENRNNGGKTEVFYIFRMLVGSMIIQIPAYSADKIGLRPVITCEKADRLLTLIKSLEVPHEENWNRRCRENMERIKSGDAAEVACVVKSLEQRNRIRSLSSGERKIFHSASMILTSELAMAKCIPYESAEKLLESVLEQRL